VSNTDILKLVGQDLTIVAANDARDDPDPPTPPVSYFKELIYYGLAWGTPILRAGSLILDKDVVKEDPDTVTVTVDKTKRIIMSLDLTGGISNTSTHLWFTITDGGSADLAASFDYQT